jgi:hypothetical protein
VNIGLKKSAHLKLLPDEWVSADVRSVLIRALTKNAIETSRCMKSFEKEKLHG